MSGLKKPPCPTRTIQTNTFPLLQRALSALSFLSRPWVLPRISSPDQGCREGRTSRTPWRRRCRTHHYRLRQIIDSSPSMPLCWRRALARFCCTSKRPAFVGKLSPSYAWLLHANARLPREVSKGVHPFATGPTFISGRRGVSARSSSKGTA